MKTLYEAANAIEAHMLLDLLAQQGLSAHIHGEHLQGAIGELPAAGLVRLVIPEEQYERAREVITRWESAQPLQSPPPAPRAPTRGGRAAWFFVAGLLVGSGALYAFVRAPVSADGVDHNRDGLLDETWILSARGTPVRLEVDRNLDKKVDYIARYDARGTLDTATSDDDFDGRFETRLSFRAGNVETSETDSDGDGFADLFSDYDSGVIRRTEYRDARTGRAVRVEHYGLGRVVHADVDTDADGRLDTRVTYSATGAEAARAPLPAPDR